MVWELHLLSYRQLNTLMAAAMPAWIRVMRGLDHLPETDTSAGIERGTLHQVMHALRHCGSATHGRWVHGTDGCVIQDLAPCSGVLQAIWDLESI